MSAVTMNDLVITYSLGGGDEDKLHDPFMASCHVVEVNL